MVELSTSRAERLLTLTLCRPESHHGPVLDYLAPVSAESWSDIDKTTLSFVKISEGGLVDGSSAPGTWASDQLIANNNSWVVTIPESVAPGKYVLRHEIIALHSAGQDDGAQLYPQCVNLEITGSGTTSIEGGEPATSFYKQDDAGILVNIYTTGYEYQIPGPTLWSGAAAAASQTGVAATGTAAASSVASSTVATSAPAAASTVAAQKTQEPQETAEPSFYSGSSSTATADAGATTATSSCTTTVYVTATDAVTVTGAAPYSAIATLASAIPSEALTSTLPAYSAAPVPTGGYSGSENGTIHWGDLPSKPLPEGWCLKDLLQWVAYLLKQSWTKGDQRNHARDFKEASDVKLFKSFAKAML